MATEISEEAYEIVDDIQNGYLSLDEEIEQEDSEVLSDTIQSIAPIENEKTNDLENNKEDNSDYSDGDTFSENSTENEEVMNEDQYKIMIIFSMGLLLGALLGNNLTGFIK